MKSKQDNPKRSQFDSGVWLAIEQLGTSFLQDVVKVIVKTNNFSRDYSIKLAKISGVFLDPIHDGHTKINIISILDSENTWNVRIVYKNKKRN